MLGAEEGKGYLEGGHCGFRVVDVGMLCTGLEDFVDW